jgi:hypothetical protein
MDDVRNGWNTAPACVLGTCGARRRFGLGRLGRRRACPADLAGCHRAIVRSIHAATPRSCTWHAGACGYVDVCRRGTERSSRNERITVTYSCAEDDGRPIGIGFQEQVPNQSELLRSKAVVVNVGSKVPDHRGRWASESRAKANPRRRVDNHTCRQNRRRSIPLGSVRRVPDDRADGDRRIGGGSWTQASTRNCGNQILDAKGEAQAAQTARREYRSQDLGRIDP